MFLFLRLKDNRRFKRRSVSDFLKKLNFKLELPGIDWGTRVGSKNLGASFGIRMKNKMELKTGKRNSRARFL